ncbi:type II toxin-antitoxin system RelE/ParE family toxin [Sphingomonas hankookensis]|uniref:type II toxin-antitoxin system RelE/ParE family toxin n=1 Tax=Sphingomonas hankookensis TaxID=563996 RepID=UPI001F592DEC|nr:type II toxin-antitoxin system RelE/ParE family toxin [Sphingomonas hankookensis]
MIALNWSGPARADLEAIDDTLSIIDLALADRMIDRIEGAGSFLREHPMAGSTILSGAVRKWRVRGTPYLLLYRPLADRIEILRIRHDREDWDA